MKLLSKKKLDIVRNCNVMQRSEKLLKELYQVHREKLEFRCLEKKKNIKKEEENREMRRNKKKKKDHFL